ncbi:MAG: extracellular solute-binding protein [Treponema sp.]|jgi:lactose/L-arabinose transport system substrate-binding protein|nr:extracellular solute-binding protein [Treponema sp.]
MKKGLIVLLIATVLWTGCTKKEQPASQTSEGGAVEPGPVTLTVWCWDPNFNIYAMNEAAKVYKQINPNVTVNIIETPWDDVQQKLITSFGAGETSSLPDIVLMQDNAIQKNVVTYPGSFLALNGKVDLSQFAQYKVDVATVDGQSFGVPFDNGATATFLRRDIIEQAGLTVADFNDITWERFIELGQQVLSRTGIPMISADTTSLDFVMMMLQGSGTWFFKEDGTVNIRDNPALRRCIEIVAQMIQTGILLRAADWNEYISTINNGKVASTIQGCWIIGSITAEESQSGQWAVVNTPRFATVDSVNYSSQGGSSWMILASSKNQDAALDFLNKTFAGSVEFYGTILPSSGAIGTWLPAANSSAYSEPQPFFGGQKVYEDIVNYASKVPNVKYGVYNYEARTEVTRALESILQGTPIDTALATAHQNLEFLIQQ